MNKKRTNILSNLDSIDLEFDEASSEYGKYPTVSLSYGFPDYLPPKYLLNALEDVARNKSWQLHQYAEPRGENRLRIALAKFYFILFNKTINPENEILVTGGAMQSLSFAIQAFLTPGSEIIVFEPFYASYDVMIKLTGAVPVYVPFRTINCRKPYTSSDLTFDKDELESKFNSKTKMILVNNPNNPTGKTFTWDELKFIAYLSIKYDVIVISDEVAQFYHYDGSTNNRIATLPNMWERTITVNSGGKTFSNTGWRLGWAIGPAHLLHPMTILLAENIISLPPLLQIPFAMAIETETKRYNTVNSYFYWLRNEMKRMRDRVYDILKNLGIQTFLPNSGFYLIADFENLMSKIDLSAIGDNKFKLVLWLIKEKHISLHPLNIYYSEKYWRSVENMTRICFIKSNDTINKFEEAMLSIINN